MKKFVINICVLVVLVFIGFTTYYVVRNDEDIKYSINKGTVVYLNLGETFTQPFVHSSPAHASKVDVETSGGSCYYDVTKKAFITSVAGTSDVTLTPTNKDFPSLTFTIKVGSGTQLNPYYIRNEKDLQNIGKDNFLLSDNYEIVNDIVLTKEFSPIGSATSPFSGSIFGGEKMYKIKNLKIIDQKLKSAGLFGSIGSTGKVERLTIDGMQATGDYQYLGAVAGINYGLIGQCKVENTILIGKNQNGFTGGITGLNQTITGYAQVSLCTFDGEITGFNYTGGAVGTNAGGVLSNNKIIVKKAALLSGTSVFGGLVGFNSFSQSEIEGTTYFQNSVLVNNLSILNNIGTSGAYASIIGTTKANPTEPRTISYFNMCMTQSPADMKAIQSNINDSVVLSHDNAQNHYNNVLDLSDKKHFANVSNSTWSFDGFWQSSPNSNSIEIDYIGCVGSYQDLPMNSSVYYLIKDESSLISALDTIRKYPSANLEYKIMKSINLDFAAHALLKDKVFAPIGTKAMPFIGKIYTEGNAVVTISNAKISSDEYAGFFGVVSGANTLIKGFKIKNIQVTGDNVGGLVGLNSGATIKECTVSSKGLEASSVLGGVVGINQGTMMGCEFTLSEINLNHLENSYFHMGFVAGQNSGNIISCESNNISLNVTETKVLTYYLGGIVGESNGGKIEDCLAMGKIGGKFASGNIYAGGLVGRMEQTTITSSIVDSFTIDFSKTKGINAAGVASFADNKSSIKNTLVQNTIITSHRSSGFVSDNSATITESAVGQNVSLSGRFVGGFAIEHNGSIKNSYTLATLQGDDAAAGFVLNLNKGSEVRFCYNFCSYISSGKAYCETSTPFRASQNYGTLLNCVVVGKLFDSGMFGDKIWVTLRSDKKYEALLNDPEIPDKSLIKGISPSENEQTATIQTYRTSKGSFRLISSDVATGVSNYAEFEEAGFDSNLWNFNVPTDDGEEEIINADAETALTPEEILKNKLEDIFVDLTKCFTLINLPKLYEEI